MAINLLTSAIGEEMVNPILAYLEGEIRKLNPNLGKGAQAG